MPASAASGQGHVLVVEDEWATAAALAEGLRRDGFRVTTVGDGLQAFDLALAGSFDVLVVDLMLPSLDGLGLCGRLRAAGVHTPVLVLTARTAERDELLALRTGADDFLPKPFSYRILLARLQVLVGRAGRSTAAVLTVGDLVLDRRSRTCRRGDVGIELTPREFGLLELLMSRPGQVVSKRRALDEVWDPALDEASNVVEVYVSYLRRKIDLPFGRHSVRTVRGAGYRLDADAD